MRVKQQILEELMNVMDDLYHYKKWDWGNSDDENKRIKYENCLKIKKELEEELAEHE